MRFPGGNPPGASAGSPEMDENGENIPILSMKQPIVFLRESGDRTESTCFTLISARKRGSRPAEEGRL